MTYEQKLKEEHPDCIKNYFYARFCGCPSTFGYEPQHCGLCGGDRNKINDSTCKKCWSREMKR